MDMLAKQLEHLSDAVSGGVVANHRRATAEVPGYR